MPKLRSSPYKAVPPEDDAVEISADEFNAVNEQNEDQRKPASKNICRKDPMKAFLVLICFLLILNSVWDKFMRSKSDPSLAMTTEQEYSTDEKKRLREKLTSAQDDLLSMHKKHAAEMRRLQEDLADVRHQKSKGLEPFYFRYPKKDAEIPESQTEVADEIEKASISVNTTTTKLKKQFKLEDLAFLHIPKTGGSSIEELGHECGLRWGKYWYFEKAKNREESRSEIKYSLTCGGNPYHLPLHYFPENPFKDKLVFCVIRDPFSRFLSEYGWLHHLKRVKKCTASAMNAWLATEMKKIFEYPILKNEERPSYRFEFNCHLTPQYEYVFNGNGEKSCDVVLRFERLGPDWHMFLDTMVVQSENITNIRKIEEMSIHSEYPCKLTIDDLSYASKALLRKHYAKDFSIDGTFDSGGTL